MVPSRGLESDKLLRNWVVMSIHRVWVLSVVWSMENAILGAKVLSFVRLSQSFSREIAGSFVCWSGQNSRGFVRLGLKIEGQNSWGWRR
jgi:hypothetical protein